MSPAKAKKTTKSTATTSKKKAAPKTKTTAAKKTARKPAKKATTKKSNAKKGTRKPAKRKISAEERYNMIQTAAYFRAQRDGFKGDSMQYWINAEKEIDTLLAKK